MAGPALADEFRPAPKRERAAAPERAAPQRAAPQQQASNWTGGQVGGSNGASSVNNSFVEPGAFNYAPGCGGPCYQTPFSFSGHPTSYIIGGFLGYRVQVGLWVVGIEGDINWQKGETSYAQNTPPPWLGYELFTGSQKQGSDGSIRGRIGFLVTPRTLVYATGGLAIGKISGSFSYTGCQSPTCADTISSSGFTPTTVFITTPNPISPGILPDIVTPVTVLTPTTVVTSATNVKGVASWSDTRVGGTVGVGAETELWTGVKARLEYRYTDYGKFSKDVPLSTNNPSCGVSCGTTAHIDMRAFNHRLMVGLGFDL
jgi:outer membrane immunogenic protein